MSEKDFLIKYTKGYRLKLVGVIFSVLIYVLARLARPLVIGFFLDNVIQGLSVVNPFINNLIELLGGVDFIRSNLWIAFLILLFCELINFVFTFNRGKLEGNVAEGMVENIRNDLYQHIQYLPYFFHQDNKAGELVQKCTSDVELVRRFFIGQFGELTSTIFTTIIAMIILFNINVQLALIGLIAAPIILINAVRFFNKMTKVFLASDEAEGELTNIIQNNLSSIRVVKAFNKERFETERFDKMNQEYVNKTVKVIRLLGGYFSFSDFICLLQVMAVVIFGAFLSVDGHITVGDLFVFVSYETTIVFSIRMMGRIIADMGKMFVSIKRLVAILDQKTEDVVSGSTSDLSGDIVFKDVCFAFADDQNKNALNNVNLTIAANATTAIMGPVGSGKSTLMHLLSRLYDYSAGSITINDVELNTISKNHLRKNIGIVLQEPFLFSKSIGENIKIANPSANINNINKAAKIASVHDVINEFDKGYETIVGEKGVTLSGGQKQRISIARVIINEVKILIFDDSLSAVDSETDKQIRTALKELAQGITTILITHRCDSASSADKIVVLEDGKVSQEGTHDQLVDQEGFYQRIYQIQTAEKETL
ncbi:MAG: ABC transporter ATP-binding protein [Erysipelotrichaceae bacterium]